MVNPALGTQVARSSRPHRNNTAATRAERREYQAWLSNNPQTRAERYAMDALVISARRRSNGQVVASCVCGWTGYAVSARCLNCRREL